MSLLRSKPVMNAASPEEPRPSFMSKRMRVRQGCATYSPQSATTSDLALASRTGCWSWWKLQHTLPSRI